MKKAVIFDFDYTLGDSTPGIVQSMNYAFEKMGLDVQPEAAIRKTIGRTLKDAYGILTGDKNAEQAQQFAELFREKADEIMTDLTVLFPGVKELLQKLKDEGYKLGIVTTKFRYRIEAILTKYGASEMMDLVVGSEDVKVEKPDPEGLLWAMKHLNVSKDETLYVGDSVVDAKTAENTGVDFAAVLTGTTQGEEFAAYTPVETAESVTQIKSLAI